MNNFKTKRNQQKRAVRPITALNYSLKNLSSAGQPLYFSRKTILQLIEGLQNKANSQDSSQLAKESLQILEDVSYNINKILSNLHKIGHTLYEQEVANMEEYDEEYEDAEIEE